jgi:23S rRNA pseudouridine2605 synthase
MAALSKQKHSGKVPLERAFSKLGLASRSQAKKWIMAGNVRLNGKVITDPFYLVVPERAQISLNHAKVKSSAWRTVMLYKPKGVVTTRLDEQGRPTVFSLLSENTGYLHPVGRLDMATTGLLLMTNDTRLSSWLTDPKNKVVRVYLVTVAGLVTEAATRKILEGVQDKGELLKADKVILRKASARESHLTVELTEGKNREIRRIFDKIGHEVIALKRVAFGGMQLGKMVPGQFREVSQKELLSVFGSLAVKV